MATKGEVLGAIDCPVCGYRNGMRIATDKNGEPFGFCEANCDAQLRVGGKKSRVEQFYRNHSGIKRPGDSPPTVQPVAAAVTVASSKEGVTVTEQKPAAPVPVQKKSSSWASLMGVGE